MTEFLVVITTTETRDEALAIAREVVRTRVAACAQVRGPLTSVFRWEGAVEEADEHLCVMKTTSNAYKDLERVIRSLHPYEVPEILALPVETGGRDYLDWVRAETGPSTGT